MEVSPFFIGSYVVSSAATFVLFIYFLREWRAKKLRASLAWCLGFLFYFFTMVTDLAVAMIGEVSAGAAAIAFGLLVVALGVTLFYYGASLLFFSQGSFFREKLSLIILVIFTVLSIYLVVTLPTEGFRDEAAPYIQLMLMSPVFLVIAVLFYRVSTRLGADDPRRRTVLLVASGWFILLINSIYRGTYLGYSATVDAIVNLVHLAAWFMLLYGMVYGRVAKT